MSLYPEILDIVESYAKETMTEAKFAAQWIKMPLEEKNLLRESLGVRLKDPFSSVKLARFSFREDQSRSEVLESLLNYALLNTVPDYDEDMLFVPGDDDYYQDLVLIARSYDIASLMLGIMYEIKNGMTNYKDIIEESSESLSKLYDIFVTSHPGGFSIRSLEGEKIGKNVSVITPETIFSMIREKSSTIDKEEEDEEE